MTYLRSSRDRRFQGLVPASRKGKSPGNAVRAIFYFLGMASEADFKWGEGLCQCVSVSNVGGSSRMARNVSAASYNPMFDQNLNE